MLLISVDHGQTLVDNVPLWATDDPQVEELYEDIEEVEDTYSGQPWDYWM